MEHLTMHIIDGQDVQHYCFYYSNRLPTITICYCSINHHKPTTLCFHGNIFGYVVAWSFTHIGVNTISQKCSNQKIFTFKYSYSQICGNLLSKLDALYSTAQDFPDQLIKHTRLVQILKFNNECCKLCCANASHHVSLSLKECYRKSNYVYKVCYYIVDSNC